MIANSISDASKARPRVWIKQIAFSDGTSIDLNDGDTVVLVGPNNCGKSASLRGIRDLICELNRPPGPVITNITIEKQGTADDLLTWANSVTLKRDGFYHILDAVFSDTDVRHFWSSKGACLSNVGKIYCRLLNAFERLNGSAPAENIDFDKTSPSNPIHFLYDNDALEAEVSNEFRKAFGADLVVNRNAGKTIPLVVGSRPIVEPCEDRISRTYVAKIKLMPALHEQGDGMRSFASILLSIMAGSEDIKLIDEPELFLHPPQARLLGRLLVTRKQSKGQLFIATHSGDVLRGILDANNPHVRVLRIQRSNTVNTVKELGHSAMSDLWKDPLLRHSNILDGLFHEKVLVCEGDADARFYSAVMHASVESKNSDNQFPDIMFTHCGGKARLAMVVTALRAVSVPIKVVADIDILNDINPLKSVVVAAGGNWDALAKDWEILKKSIDLQKDPGKTKEVKSKIDELFSSITEESLPSAAKSKIEAILKSSSRWTNIKQSGKSAIPSGDPTQAFNRLNSGLKEIGIFIVDVGEIEGFDRSVGNHGPAWVNEVLKKDMANAPELAQARDFIAQFIS